MPHKLLSVTVNKEDFYLKRLQEKYGLEVIVPEPGGRHAVYDIIFNELCLGPLTLYQR
ncbi:hypothetical protein [Methanomethylovorans sp.]|uniref:hypothetical protein n=1 Tax=Methanomethylovorans sp. TaxID=2758717 RepID=UPI00351C9531